MQTTTTGKTTADYLRDAMDEQGISDPVIRAGIPAIASAEGGLGEMKSEIGYAHTDNYRIRTVFGARVSSLSDPQLNALKADPRKFFNWVYGGQFQHIHHLGNRPDTDDGYNFRGRGPIQFTGRANYERYSRLAGHYDEVMEDVEKVNNPLIGAGMTVAYIVDRYKGGGFEALMQCVGNNTPDIANRKRAAYAKFKASGEFDPSGNVAVKPSTTKPAAAKPSATSPFPAGAKPSESTSTLRLGDRGDRVEELQSALGMEDDEVDGVFGSKTEAAVKGFQLEHGLNDDGIVGPLTQKALGI